MKYTTWSLLAPGVMIQQNRITQPKDQPPVKAKVIYVHTQLEQVWVKQFNYEEGECFGYTDDTILGAHELHHWETVQKPFDLAGANVGDVIQAPTGDQYRVSCVFPNELGLEGKTGFSYGTWGPVDLLGFSCVGGFTEETPQCT